MRKNKLPNNGLGEVINLDKNGVVFDPETVILSEELSREIHEIITRSNIRILEKVGIANV